MLGKSMEHHLQLQRLVTQEDNLQKEENAIDCLQYFSDCQHQPEWEAWRHPRKRLEKIKTPRLDTARPTLRMKLQKALARTPNPYLSRQCNRTPLILSTKLIENHDTNPPSSTHKSLSRARVEKENIIAREIRNATRHRIKPHKDLSHKREMQLVGEVLRRRGEGFNIDSLIRRLQDCRKPSAGDVEGKLPPLCIKTYDLRLL